MLMHGVAVINAMMIFIWFCNNHAPGYNRINFFFHHKGNISGDVEINFTLAVNMAVMHIGAVVGINAQV